MREITVTEENFSKILEKIQKVCNKYKMLKFYRVLSEDMVEQKEYRNNSIGIRYDFKEYKDRNGEWNLKKKRKLYYHSSYVRVSKHHFRKEFEENKNTFNVKQYLEMKPLIHLDLSGSSALVIHEGDKVQFLPFGAFVVWTDDDYTRFEKPLSIYKDIFVPDIINGKIENLNKENDKRNKECEEEADWWNKQWEKDMENEMKEYNNDWWFDEDE